MAALGHNERITVRFQASVLARIRAHIADRQEVYETPSHFVRAAVIRVLNDEENLR